MAKRLSTGQKDFEQTFVGVQDLFIDATEISIERADNQDTQQSQCSGKKQHTLKWLLVCDQFRRILFISKMYDGHVHDFTIFKEVFTGIALSLFRVHVDSSFTGLERYVTPRFIFKPTKAYKNTPLTSSQCLCNGALASVRVCVEHAIAKAKAFFSLRIENRLKQKQSSMMLLLSVLG